MKRIEIETGHPVPVRRRYRKQLSDEDRVVILAMPVGTSFLVDADAAVAVRSFAGYYRIRLVQKKEGDKVRLWRAADDDVEGGQVEQGTKQ